MAKPKSTNLKIRNLSGAVYPVVTAFNVATVEKIEFGFLVHVGMQTATGLCDSYSFIIDQEVLDLNKENWAQYLTVIDDGSKPAKGARKYQPLPRQGLVQIPVANVVLWNRRNNACEIRCFALSLGEITEAVKKSGEISAQPLALLQCQRSVQAQVLSEILTPQS